MIDCPGNSAIDPLFSLISAVSSIASFLLPRLLILELLCACHWFEYTKAVDVLTCEAKEGAAKKEYTSSGKSSTLTTKSHTNSRL